MSQGANTETYKAYYQVVPAVIHTLLPLSGHLPACSIEGIVRDIQTEVIGFKKFPTAISNPKVPNYRVLFCTNKVFFRNTIVCREMKSITNMLTICECAFIYIFLVMLTQPSLELLAGLVNHTP